MIQPLLFDVHPDKPLTGYGAVRTWTGNFVEDIICRAMGWTKLHIDGRKAFCADAQTPGGQDVEIKSVKLTKGLVGKSVIYDWRMEKEQKHSPDLLYAFVGAVGAQSIKADSLTLAAVLDRLAAVPLRLAVVNSLWVHGIALDQPLNKISADRTKPRYGNQRFGYNRGYRNVPVGQWFNANAPQRTVEVPLHGRTFTILTNRLPTPEILTESTEDVIIQP